MQPWMRGMYGSNARQMRPAREGNASGLVLATHKKGNFWEEK